jgi:hypothetical protein
LLKVGEDLPWKNWGGENAWYKPKLCFTGKPNSGTNTLIPENTYLVETHIRLLLMPMNL